jgi:DNA-binding MarR family transcriptional regulator
MTTSHVLDLSPVPPPLYGKEPKGRPVSFHDIVRDAGMQNVVTLAVPPDIRIHGGAQDFKVPRIGGAVYCISGIALPSDPPAWSREILRRLAYGFFDYAAREVVARYHRDLKRAKLDSASASEAKLDSASASEKDARLARRALSEASLRIKRVLRENESASIGDLTRMTGMAQPNVSRIIHLLIKSGSVSITREGKRVICRLTPEASAPSSTPRNR